MRLVSRILCLALLGGACTDQVSEETVITAQTIGDRLRVDLSEGSFRFDPKDGPIDPTLVEVVKMDGTVVKLDELAVQMGATLGAKDGFKLSDLAGVPQLVAYTIWNLEWRYTTSETSSQWWRSPTTSCSPGTALFGIGAALPENVNNAVLFRGMRPYGSASPIQQAQASGQEDYLATTQNWNLTTYAVCGTQFGTMAKMTSASSNTNFPNKVASAYCPGVLKVVGGGGMVYGGEGRVKVDMIVPSADLTHVTAYASVDQNGTSSSWYVEAYAICAAVPAGLELERYSASIPAPSSSWWAGREVIASCPAGKRLLGVGGGFDANDKRALRVLDIVPSVDLTYAIVKGSFRGPLAGTATGTLNAYAICAKPSDGMTLH